MFVCFPFTPLLPPHFSFPSHLHRSEISSANTPTQPFNNVLTTMSSFPASNTPNTTSILLFPSFQKIPAIPHTPEAHSALATAYLKAPSLHPAHASLSPAQKSLLTRDPSLASQLTPPTPITKPTILICSHGGRDQRCGVLGPLLQARFREVLGEQGVDADVGLISHIGGHKYAGNVIVYLPPGMRNEWAGSGIWYGRVGPDNVGDVVRETVVRGRVVMELLRGGITGEGGDVARMVEPREVKEGLRLRPRARG